MEMKLYCMPFIQVIKKTTVDFQSISFGILAFHYTNTHKMGNSHICKLNIPTESLKECHL